jgi:hypothetical protein
MVQSINKVTKNEIKFFEITKFNQLFKVRYESLNGVQYLKIDPQFKNKTTDQWGIEIGIFGNVQTKRGENLTHQQLMDKCDEEINKMVNDRTYILCKQNNNEDLKSLIMDYYLSGMIQTEICEEGPSEGDIECIIELLIEDEKLPDDFDSLLNQALSIFNIK